MTYKRLTLKPGVVVNVRTARMLQEVEARLGRKLTLVQGSYNAGKVAASAGTHDGGGVVDVRSWDLGVGIPQVLLTLRQVGFAAWYRTQAQGFDPHIHCVAIGDRELSPSARQQVAAYRLGRNGLANNAADDGPRVASWRTWKAVILARRVKAAQASLAKWKRDHA